MRGNVPFTKYAAAGFGSELLPILPPDARINPASPQAENLLESRGKTPGRLSRDGWFGFGRWTSHQSSPQDHQKWRTWGAGVGMQGRKFPALDIDVDLGGIADGIANEAFSSLGLGPTRSRGGARRLLVYAGEGITKRRLAFRFPGGLLPAAADVLHHESDQQPDGPDVLDPRRVHAVELLGSGQQYVCEGVHPSGRAYEWAGGVSPADWASGAAGLAVITAEEVDAFFAWVETYVVSLGAEIVTNSGSGAGLRDGAWQAGLQAPSLEAARGALGAIDPNDLDYDQWIQVMAAFKAATEGL
jgi:hypothetical protein